MNRPIFATLATALSVVTASWGAAQEELAAGVRELVPDLVSMSPEADARYRVAPLSGTLAYVVFASSEDRRSLLEGLLQRVPELSSSVPVWLSDVLLEDAFANVAPGGGAVDSLRRELVGAGIVLPPRQGRPTALITAVAASDLAEVFDFSMSRMQEDIIDRGEALDRLEGRSAAESAALKFAGPDHPTVALFEPWRFDDLPDAIDDKNAAAAAAARLAEVRRARFEVEVVRALFHVDLTYEEGVIEWLEGLDQGDVNLLARMLQIAGLREISPEILVRQGTPLLWEPSVLRANLFGGLERVTKSVGRKGARRLDPDRFASEEVLEQASAFYPQFFAGNGRGELQLELLDSVDQRIEVWASEIRELTAPIFDRHLAGLADLALEP